jgi:hypothetical protein
LLARLLFDGRFLHFRFVRFLSGHGQSLHFYDAVDSRVALAGSIFCVSASHDSDLISQRVVLATRQRRKNTLLFTKVTRKPTEKEFPVAKSLPTGQAAPVVTILPPKQPYFRRRIGANDERLAPFSPSATRKTAP